MRTAFTALVLTSVVAGSCGGGVQPNDRLDGATLPGPYAVTLLNESLLPGSTNSTVTPVVNLRALSPMGPETAALILRDLVERAHFVAPDGSFVGAIEGVLPHDSEYTFMLQPIVPLRIDAWYDLTYQSTILSLAPGVEVAATIVGPFNAYLGAGVVTRFFTGSAPQLRAVVMNRPVIDGGVQGAGSLILSLSEPVSLDQLLSGGIGFAAGVPVAPTCLIGGRECRTLGGSSAAVAELVYEFGGGVPPQFEIALDVSLTGVARTVEDTLNLEAVRGATAFSEGRLRYAMDTANWRQRSSSGSMVGWCNVEP